MGEALPASQNMRKPLRLSAEGPDLLNCRQCRRLHRGGCRLAIALRAFGCRRLLGTPLEAFAIGAWSAWWHWRAGWSLFVPRRALEGRSWPTPGLSPLGPGAPFIAAKAARPGSKLAAVELPSIARGFKMLPAPISLRRPELMMPFLRSRSARIAAIFPRSLRSPSTVGVHARSRGPLIL